MSLAKNVRIISFVPRKSINVWNFGDECFDRRDLEDQVQNAFLRGLKQGRSEGYDTGFNQGDFQGFNRG